MIRICSSCLLIRTILTDSGNLFLPQYIICSWRPFIFLPYYSSSTGPICLKIGGQMDCYAEFNRMPQGEVSFDIYSDELNVQKFGRSDDTCTVLCSQPQSTGN